jgi:hypothetical protein
LDAAAFCMINVCLFLEKNNELVLVKDEKRNLISTIIFIPSHSSFFYMNIIIM